MKWCGAEILTQHLPDNQAEINRLGTRDICGNGPIIKYYDSLKYTYVCDL